MNSINSFLPANLGEALGWMVLHSLWQVVTICFLTAVALLALRNKPAMLRYRVANLALLGVLIAATATFYYYYEPAPSPVASFPQIVVSDALMPNQAADNQALPIAPATQGILNGNTWQEYFSPHLPLIVCLWFMGMSIFLLKLMGNFAYVFYLKKHLNFPVERFWEDVLQGLMQKAGIRKSIQLLESALVQTPVVLGYLKPVILFPIGMINRLDPAEAEAILAHELAHILHHDYLLNIFQSLVETLFYFHPAIWWLSGKIRQERETAADDAAIRLTNNSMAYAKTLVLVQEMAFSRALEGAAFAFAGTQRSHLFHRIQHILNIKSPKNFNMEKIVGTLAVVLVLIGLGFSQSNVSPSFAEQITQATGEGDGFSGVWQAVIEKDKVCMTITSRRDGGSWMSGDCYPVSDFSSLPTKEGEFTMTRSAGKMTFTGKFEGNEGYGKFSFSPDQSFFDWLTQQGVSGMNDKVMVHLFFANTDKAYVTSLKQSGYDKISGEDLQNMAIHEVDSKKIEAYRSLAQRLGEKQPTIDKMVELSIHEVTPEYAQQLEKIGFKDLSTDDVMNFKIHEITPEFVKECRDMGYSNLGAEEVMNLKIHEITPEYAKQCREMGFKNLSLDDVMNFKIHEITPAYLQDLKKAGLTSLSADEVLNMKIHEVSPEKVEAFRKMGFANLSHDDILNLQIHEVDPEFMGEMSRLGFKDLSADEAVNLRIHEIDADFVAKLKAAGFTDLSMDEIVNCKVHEIDASYVSELKKAGFTDLSVEEVINCKIHEVSPEQVKAFEGLGFQKMNVEDAVNLHIHEVTPEFIKSMREKGFKDMDLEEYIQLKIQFGDKLEGKVRQN